MTKKPPGKTGIYFDLPADVVERFRAFVDGFGMGSLADHAAMAMVRHMQHPPTLDKPELPDEKSPADWKPPRKKVGPKKGGKK